MAAATIITMDTAIAIDRQASTPLPRRPGNPDR
jgi:hypothetical protein